MVEQLAMGTRQAITVRAVAFPTAALLIWMGAAVAEEAPYPVKIVAPWLELEGSDEAAIIARFDQPLQSSESKLSPIEYVKFRDDWKTSELPFADLVVDRVQPTTCTELSALMDAGYVPWGDPIYLDNCTQLTLLRRARPARESYVRDFVMSADAVDVLPVMVANGALFNRLCEEYIANQRGVPWNVFDKIVEIEGGNGITMIVSTEHRDGRMEGDNGLVLISGGSTRVSIVAWGDFDGDGVEDLMIDSSSHPLTWNVTKGSGFIHPGGSTDVYVVTRDAPGAVMRVVDPERHLTPDKLDDKPCVYP